MRYAAWVEWVASERKTSTEEYVATVVFLLVGQVHALRRLCTNGCLKQFRCRRPYESKALRVEESTSSSSEGHVLVTSVLDCVGG